MSNTLLQPYQIISLIYGGDFHLFRPLDAHFGDEFRRISQEEIVKEDNDFICKIMKLDPRDRPLAKELLSDEWFHDVNSSSG